MCHCNEAIFVKIERSSNGMPKKKRNSKNRSEKFNERYAAAGEIEPIHLNENPNQIGPANHSIHC